jgi:hypothetical protein
MHTADLVNIVKLRTFDNYQSSSISVESCFASWSLSEASSHGQILHNLHSSDAGSSKTHVLGA